jgi:primosomal protein N' (replication factor Y)
VPHHGAALELFPEVAASTAEPIETIATTRPDGRVVRVLPDVAGIERTFDYVVPAAWDAPGDARGAIVQPGSLVRIDLHGRRVGAWVLEVDVEPPAGVALRPLAKVSSIGPPVEVIELARETAWRWYGRVANVLTTASPPTTVRVLPPVRPHVPAPQGAGVAYDDAFATTAPRILRLPPADDAFDVVAAATRRGNALILAPSIDEARAIATRLRRSGVTVALHPRDWALGASGATVVGVRAAAFAPVHDLASIVVIDEHAEAYQEERMPTWHARDVCIERARRAGIPCVLTSPAPTLDALAVAEEHAPSRTVERAGWPIVDVIDRRRDDVGHGGLFSERIVSVLRGEGPVLCVLNRTGRSRLLACAACGELARCERCHAAVTQRDDGTLVCGQCTMARPALCASCGSQQLKNLRLGVTRAREELEALAQRPVAEVTAEHERGERTSDLYIGTEAVLHQVRTARAVVFLDFDQELLAPRFRAAEQAMGLLVRAARVVGSRATGGRVVVQTRLPRHEVLDAALHADPGRLVVAERANRQALRYPPFSALAVVSGVAAPMFVERLAATADIDVLGPNDGRWLVRATDHGALADALAGVERPLGRLRVEVDPHRV